MGYGLVVIMLLLLLDVYAFAITVRSRMPGPDQVRSLETRLE